MVPSRNLFYLFIIYGGVICASKNYTIEGFVEVTESEYEVQSTTTQKSVVTVECETPNRDIGVCVDIRQCHKLKNQLQNKKAWAFLRESECKKASANNFYPKVCCGQYDNFRTVAKTCGQQKLRAGDRIYGGRPALLGQYPWMAILLHRNRHGETVLGCTGFLIHTKYVITAAHCTHPESLKERGPIISILLGEHDILSKSDCDSITGDCFYNTQEFPLDRVATHPDYDQSSTDHYNDIAIIKLNKNALVTDFVRPICLLTNDSQIPVSYRISGWGRTENASYSPTKQEAEIKPFDKTKCIEKFSNINMTLKDTQICAGGEEMIDTCTGDSGGPLMMETKDNTWYAAGIVSFGVSCGMKDWPGVYTNIVKFLPWIKSQMADEDEINI